MMDFQGIYMHYACVDIPTHFLWYFLIERPSNSDILGKQTLLNFCLPHLFLVLNRGTVYHEPDMIFLEESENNVETFKWSSN